MIDLDELKRSTDMVAIFKSYGVALRKRGNEYDGLCPWHDDHKPSMQVYIDAKTGYQRYHCKACTDVGGTVIDLVMSMEKITEGEAIKQLHYRQPQPYQYQPKDKLPLAIWKYQVAPNGSMPRMYNKEHGDPVKVWRYNNAAGDCIGYVARYIKADGEKNYLPFTYGSFSENVLPVWKPRSWAAGEKPLYGLDLLAERPEDKIIICEGEKATDAARILLPGNVSISWPGGAGSVNTVDWSPIAGRDILLIPDNDQSGRNCMMRVGRHLLPLGCKVRMIDTSDQPEKWDLADALEDGWTTQQLVDWAKPRIQHLTNEILERENSADYTEEDEPDYEESELTAGDVKLTPSGTPSVWQKSDNLGIVWTTPQDIFSELNSPPIQPDMVPDCLHEWIADTSAIKGVDPSILALSATVAAAALLHDSIKIQPELHNPSWKESARLWGAIVGASAIKKTPAINAALSHVKKIQVDLSAKASRLEDEYRAQEMAYELQRKGYIKKLSEADPTAINPAKPEMPEISRLLIQDVTVDKLAELLKSCSRGCIVDKPELAGWFGSMDAYKSGAGGSDRAAWLTFYDGGPLYVDRIGRGSIYVPNFGGCILGAIQPESFARIAASLPEDGLLQRFMIVNGRTGQEGDESPYNKEANDRYHTMQQRLFDTLIQPNPITLSIEANDVRKEITRYAFKLISINFISSGMCSFLGKWEGLSARLMLTFHAMECVDKNIHPQSCQISARTAEMVKRFMIDFLLPHATAFYVDVMGRSEIGKHLRKIAELCLANETGEIANRDFMLNWTGWRHVKPNDQETIINQLIDNGWLLPVPGARVSTKGFPTRYLINPDIKILHAERMAAEIERRKIVSEAIKADKKSDREHMPFIKREDQDDDF